MIVLSKDNITEYLKEKMPQLDFSKPLVISAIGEGSEEEDGDGFLNFVFRVSDGHYKLIVKQSRSTGRRGNFKDLPENRSELEYQSMEIRKAIVPDLLPDLYFYDGENHIFATEDVSHLKIIRFQLNHSIQFPKFAVQAARYLARTHFYTSEYYLDTKEFRDLTVHFMNHKMRDVFDCNAFITKKDDEQDFGRSLDPKYDHFIRGILLDPKVVLERYKLRRLFITKGEALLHGDFHTSNVFIDQEEMKVIDMEYTFCGPMSYDLGYMQSHLLSQYACAAFRPYENEKDREDFQNYILHTMQQMFDAYIDEFFACWKQDAKEIYQNVEGLQEELKQTILAEMIGFCATSNFSRCSGEIGYPEYDAIEDPVKKHNAVCLSMFLDYKTILERENYQTSADWIKDIKEIEKIYKNNITEW
jgi:5-methylthioribose kinase